MSRVKRVIVLLLTAVLMVLPLPVHAAENGEVRLTAYLYNADDAARVRCRFYDAQRQIPYIHVLDFLTSVYRGSFSLRQLNKSIWLVKNP